MVKVKFLVLFTQLFLCLNEFSLHLQTKDVLDFVFRYVVKMTAKQFLDLFIFFLYTLQPDVTSLRYCHVETDLTVTSFESHSSCLSKAIKREAISSLVFHRCLWLENETAFGIISRLSGKTNAWFTCGFDPKAEAGELEVGVELDASEAVACVCRWRCWSGCCWHSSDAIRIDVSITSSITWRFYCYHWVIHDMIQ